MGFCIHIIGTPGLDVENMEMTIAKINDHNVDEDDDITLEDIEDKDTPEYMKTTAKLQKWRCTNLRRHVQSPNTDDALSDCRDFWRTWFASEEAKKASIDNDETDTTDTDPPSHEEDLPLVPPRNMHTIMHTITESVIHT